MPDPEASIPDSSGRPVGDSPLEGFVIAIDGDRKSVV